MPDISQQIRLMLELQDSMNCKVHPQWRSQGYEWYRAIWVECAELMDHYGWKWWKKQQPDLEQVKLEIIDIWHFGLSYLLVQGTHQGGELACVIADDLQHAGQQREFRSALESFTESTLVNRGFSTREFATLMTASGISFAELYVGYIGKNVLNFFRQDHGYKDGTYIKQWGGREDNEHLVEICGLLDAADPAFQKHLYEQLEQRYRQLTQAA